MRRFFSFLFPVKGDKKSEVARKLIAIAAFIVLVVCVSEIAAYYLNSFHNKKLNSALASVYSSAPSSQADSKQYPPGMQASFRSLYDTNSDIRGWLTIPNMVNNPVVQTTDNSTYLEENFNKSADNHGTLFLDYRDSVSPLSKNLIIYGHNMKDGQMFHSIINYQMTDTYAAAPVITFNTIYANYSWKVFACFIANNDPKDGYVFNYLRTDFNSDADFTNFVAEVKARSLIKTSVDVQPGDQLLTLSTCTYPDNLDDARFVVVARMIRPGEDTAVAPATRNHDALSPTVSMK